MKTVAAVLVAHNKPLQLRELEIPALEAGQVLVKVLFSGVCHSQLMEISGKRGIDKYLPHLLGHEGSGVILDTGEGVAKVKKGDKVVLTWIKAGGMNVAGPKYLSGKQIINAGPVTTFSTLTIVSENRCVLLPEGIAPDIASLFGCAIPTGMGIVLNSIKPARNAGIAVFGLGGIGLSALLGAVVSGCKPVIAVDINADKLSLAGQFGATHLVNAREQDPVDAIRLLTGGEGINYAVEACGTTQTIEQAFRSVRPDGGLCIFASHPPAGQKISIDPFDMICGRQLRGSWGGESVPDRDVPVWADLYLRGKLPLNALITHRFPFEKINDAFALLASGSAGRIIIEMDRLS